MTTRTTGRAQVDHAARAEDLAWMGEHGNLTAYCHHGCRCRACRDAASKAQNVYLMRRRAAGGPLTVDPTGALRRIRALQRLGYTRRDLSVRLGYSPHYLAPLVAGRRTRITRDTHAAIDALYQRLSMTPGPSQRTRRWAERQRWPSPLAWEDDTIDDPGVKPAGMRRGA